MRKQKEPEKLTPDIVKTITTKTAIEINRSQLEVILRQHFGMPEGYIDSSDCFYDINFVETKTEPQS